MKSNLRFVQTLRSVAMGEARWKVYSDQGRKPVGSVVWWDDLGEYLFEAADHTSWTVEDLTSVRGFLKGANKEAARNG